MIQGRWCYVCPSVHLISKITHKIPIIVRKGRMAPVSNPGWKKRCFFLLLKTSRPALGPNQSLFSEYRGPFLGVIRPRRDADKIPPRSASLRMNGVIPYSPYVSKTWRGTTLPLCINRCGTHSSHYKYSPFKIKKKIAT